MRAVFIDRYGGPEVVRKGEQPLPELRSDDLRVRVKAASVNPIDFKTRAGEMKILLRYRFAAIAALVDAGKSKVVIRMD